MMEVFILLIIYQVKHLVADYPLQNRYMLGKFKSSGWVLPLSTHCLVHAVFTLVITYVYICSGPITEDRVYLIWQLPLLDFTLHFIMDRVKASPSLLGRFKALSKDQMLAGPSKKALRSNTLFWYSLGLDQMVHHLTHYLIIYILVT